MHDGLDGSVRKGHQARSDGAGGSGDSGNGGDLAVVTLTIHQEIKILAQCAEERARRCREEAEIETCEYLRGRSEGTASEAEFMARALRRVLTRMEAEKKSA